MASQNSGVSNYRNLLEKFIKAQEQGKYDEQVTIIGEMLRVFEGSERLKNSPRFKATFFEKMVEFIKSIVSSNTIQPETKQSRINMILRTMVKTYYEGARFDIPLYEYLNIHKVVPPSLFAKDLPDSNPFDSYTITEINLLDKNVKNSIQEDLTFPENNEVLVGHNNSGENYTGGQRRHKRKSRKTHKRKHSRKHTRRNRK